MSVRRSPVRSGSEMVRSATLLEATLARQYALASDGVARTYGTAVAPTLTVLSGLTLWLKADSLTFQNSNGTTAAAADGDVVGYWGDQTANAYNVTQGTTAAKPLLKLAIKNGMPVVRFDGSNDYLQAASAANWKFLSDGTNHTVFIACAVRGANPNAQYVFVATADGGNQIGKSLFYDDRSGLSRNDRILSRIGQGSSQPIDDLSADNVFTPVVFHVFEDQLSGTPQSTVDTVWVDGTQATTANQGGTSFSASNPTGALVIAATPTPDTFAAIDYGEVIIYNRALTATERTTVRQYLAARWAITVV